MQPPYPNQQPPAHSAPTQAPPVARRAMPVPPQPYQQNGVRPGAVPPKAYGKKQVKRKPSVSLPINRRFMLMGLVGLPVLGVLAIVMLLVIMLMVIYGTGDIVPGVSAAGINIGGKSEAEAANLLANGWNSDGIILDNGEFTVRIDPAELGFGLDTQATATEASTWGRSQGGVLGSIEALIWGVDIEPHLLIDLSKANQRLTELRPQLEQPPKNAGVQLVNGQAQAVPPVQGRVLDLDATLAKLQNNAASELADGRLDLVMVPVAPAITDATPLVQQASLLLSSPLKLEAYDPVTDQSFDWSLNPAEWSQWLVATSDTANATGLALALDTAGVKAYLDSKVSALPSGAYIKSDETVQKLNMALASNKLNAWTRVYHEPTAYTVQPGDSISSIGYDLGIPYPWIQAANPGVDSLTVGQSINIPSQDDLLPLPIIRNKRIVINISQQHMWAYENGQLVFDWVISTGIARSPTAPGIFQIQSHDVNAYAAQWNLYMPHFMGVYHPGPNVGVMNGFHGFPTDAGGGYLLWTNNLGRPATYGCILLSLENAETLFTWAEEGVVVEIQK